MHLYIWELPFFSSRDQVAVLVTYEVDGAEKRLVVCSAYLPYDSEDHPHVGSYRNASNTAVKKISSC